MVSAPLSLNAQTAANPSANQSFNQTLPEITGDEIQVIGEVFSSDEIVFSDSRATIYYQDTALTADRITVDYVTQAATAEGDVVFTGPEEEIRATRIEYSFREKQGVAFGVEGVRDGFFFRTKWDESEKSASFRRISEDEALFRGATYTRSGFPVPTSYVKASEVIIIPGERVFMKGASVWWRGVPVFYMPVHSKSLTGGSPWSFEVGAKSRYGLFARLGYQFNSRSEVPDPQNSDEYITRSQGRLGVRADFFSGKAVGVGIDSEYMYDFEKHIGSLNLYGVRDFVRDVRNPDDDEAERFIYRHRHNTILGDTIWQVNADYMSDPDIYHDIEDSFNPDEERGRLPERRFRAAATYLQEDYIARFSAEIKDRITLPVYQDPAEPLNDNLLYDADPNFRRQTGQDTDGVTSRRYGRVSEKFEGRIATRLVPLGGSGFQGRFEANVFNNLDAGYNEISSQDDERVTGVDAYYAVSHRTKLDGDGRFTWLNTVGIGAGYYERRNDEVVPSNQFAGPGPIALNGTGFANDETILASNGFAPVDFGDVNPFYLWIDYTSRLSGRLTQNLSGYVQYRVRQGTSDTLADAYAETGRLEAFEDIYDLPRDEHWIEALLSYSPIYPNLELTARGGYNLQSQQDRYANEQEYYAGVSADYENDTGEWLFNADVLYDSRQARDHRDPFSYDFAEIAGNAELSYVPIHGRYWGSLSVDGRYPLDDDPMASPATFRRRFDENDPDISIRPLIGREFGPKYDVEVFVEYNTRVETISESGILITRDLYDADLYVFAGTSTDTNQDRDTTRSTSSEPETEQQLELRVGLKVKAPNEPSRLSGVSQVSLKEKRSQEPIYLE